MVPGHSFKYVAALQVANVGSKPHLVRIETGAGHEAGKPVDKAIRLGRLLQSKRSATANAETADMWAFAAHWTGLDVNSVK